MELTAKAHILKEKINNLREQHMGIVKLMNMEHHKRNSSSNILINQQHKIYSMLI